jgi:hypothetical protein
MEGGKGMAKRRWIPADVWRPSIEATQLQSHAPIDHICTLLVPWSILAIRFGRRLQF